MISASRKNFWRENSNELKCIVPGTPVPGTPVTGTPVPGTPGPRSPRDPAVPGTPQSPGPHSPQDPADGPGAGVPHLGDLAHHGAVGPGAGVPHLGELAYAYFVSNTLLHCDKAVGCESL